MIAEKDKVISLTYELRVDSKNGDILESLDASAPLQFIFGSGTLLPKFEENISGLKVGDKFDFNLDSLNAYGEVNKDAIVDVPKAAFVVNGQVDESLLQVGKAIPMQDSAGNRLNGIVVEIADETVKMDFNHPLAGNDLFFKGEITDIRQATEEELAKGHLGESCSCDDKDCSEGCC